MTNLVDYLSPIFIKELRQGLRANHFVWPFIVVQLAAIACLAIEFVGKEVASVDTPVTQFLFHALLVLVFIFVLPLTCYNSLHSEVGVGRNIELLLMSTLSRWQIVLGKWIVANVLGLLLLSSLLPYWIARYMCGNITSLSLELLIGSIIIAFNWMMNAIVIGSSGFQTHAGKMLMIALCSIFGFLTLQAVTMSFYGFLMGSSLLSACLGLVGVALVVALNLQMGRAKMRLFEIVPETSSAANIGLLIILTPFFLSICLGPLLAILLLIVVIRIDPGPGKEGKAKILQPIL